MMKELCGEGWVPAEPPLDRDDESVIARCEGQPLKAGFLMEKVTDTRSEFHARYRTGHYNLAIKIDFDVGRGQIRVEEAEGYDSTTGESACTERG